MAREDKSSEQPTVIKKYANRRLYNTATSCYVTLDHLCQMVKEDIDFVVYDAKSGDDITRSVLTQIIVEEESKGQNLLPIGFLRQLISFYGDNMQWLVPRYLDHTMSSFSKNQEQMRVYMQEAMSGLFPFGNLEEMGKQQMAMIERTLKIFNPFEQQDSADGEPGAAPTPAAPKAPKEASTKETIDELRGMVDALREQIDALSKDNNTKV